MAYVKLPTVLNQQVICWFHLGALELFAVFASEVKTLKLPHAVLEVRQEFCRDVWGKLTAFVV
jgi:hypothetical protein